MAGDRYYLISAAGYPNLGDEWIAHIRLSQLLSNPNVQFVYIDCQNADVFLNLFPHYRNDPRVAVISAAWQWCKDIQGVGLWNGLSELDRSLSLSIPDTPAAYVWRSIFDVEQYVPTHVEILGGGFVNDLWPWHGTLLRLAQYLKVRYGSMLSWRNGSVYPIGDTLLFDLGSILPSFDAISVRDQASLDRLSIVNDRVSLVLDAVAEDLLSGNSILKRVRTSEDDKGQKPYCYVNLPRDVKEPHVFANQFAKMVKELRAIERTHDIVYLLANPVADGVALSRIKTLFPNTQICSLHEIINSSCLRGWPRLHDDSLCLTGRFHVRMYMASLGVNGKYLCNGDYYDNKHQSINELFAEGGVWTAL